MKKYILFGAGAVGRETLRYLGRDTVECFCDNSKAGELCDGLPIIDYRSLKQLHANFTVVLCSKKFANVIAMTCQLHNDQIPFVFCDDVTSLWIHEDAKIYATLCTRETLRYDEDNAYFMALEKFAPAGYIDSYFWQDVWAAEHIFRDKPAKHYDIGSRIDGFIAHLISFGQKVCLLDIRPLPFPLPGVEFRQCDATEMTYIADESIESISALCSLEHFGLGRYGDKIDPEACFKCFANIAHKLKKGGYAYIAVPIGREHLEFNAHRVFFATTVRDSFAPLELVEYSSAYKGQLERDIDLHKYDEWTEWGGERFGLFRFRKNA